MLVPFARLAFAVVGVVALLVGIGQLSSLLAPGNRFDPFPIVWGLGLGVGALAAAAWVRRVKPPRGPAVWAGIGIMTVTSLWPISYLITTPEAGSDVIALAVLPSVIGVAASLVMARAQWRAGRA